MGPVCTNLEHIVDLLGGGFDGSASHFQHVAKEVENLSGSLRPVVRPFHCALRMVRGEGRMSVHVVWCIVYANKQHVVWEVALRRRVVSATSCHHYYHSVQPNPTSLTSAAATWEDALLEVLVVAWSVLLHGLCDAAPLLPWHGLLLQAVDAHQN